MFDKNADYSEVRVYTPKVLTPDRLHKPCIMVARVPLGTVPLQAVSLPNLLECLGMSTGGGPVGISMLVPPKLDVQKEHNIFIAGYPPNASGPTKGNGAILGKHLGACVTAGVVLNYFMVVYEGMSVDSLRWKSVEEVAGLLVAHGYAVAELIQYQTPEFLIQGHASARQQKGSAK